MHARLGGQAPRLNRPCSRDGRRLPEAPPRLPRTRPRLDSARLGSAPDGAAPRPVDIGEVNGHPYFNVASIGFSAELAGELKAEAKQRWGRLGYGVAALGLLRKARPFTATLIHDGITEQVRTIQVSVGNGRHYGGGMTVSEDARPDEGVLDVYSLEVRHWWRLVALLPWLSLGMQGNWEDVRAFRTTGLERRTRRPRPVNAAGELVMQMPTIFKLRPAALRVYAPEARASLRTLRRILTCGHQVSARRRAARPLQWWSA